MKILTGFARMLANSTIKGSVNSVKTLSLACRGDAIPHLEYMPEEVKVWGTVLKELQQLYPTHACNEFLETFPLFDFREDVVPQLEDMSQILRYSGV